MPLQKVTDRCGVAARGGSAVRGRRGLGGLFHMPEATPRCGDATFAELVLACLPALRARTARYLRGCDGVDVDDVVQDTVERAWRHRDGIEPDRLLAWCSVTAKHRALDIRRAADRRRQVPVADVTPASDGIGAASPDPADLYATAEAVVAVRRALRELPEHYRRLLEATTYRELDQRQLAAEMAMTVPQVNMILHRARGKLRRALRAYDCSTKAG